MPTVQTGRVSAINNATDGIGDPLTLSYDILVSDKGRIYILENQKPPRNFPDDVDIVAAPVGSRVFVVTDSGLSFLSLLTPERIDIAECEEPTP